VSLIHHQVDVVEILTATEAVRKVVAWIHRRPKLRAISLSPGASDGCQPLNAGHDPAALGCRGPTAEQSSHDQHCPRAILANGPDKRRWLMLNIAHLLRIFIYAKPANMRIAINGL